MNFFNQLLAAIEQQNSLLYVALEPDPDSHIFETVNCEGIDGDSADILEQWQNWLGFVIRETAEFVCAYKLSLGFYLSLGIPGLKLLEKILKVIPPNIPIILDAKYSDLNSSTAFARFVFEDLKVGACTLTPYAGLDQVAPFLVYPDQAVFISCATANPSASIIQEYPQSQQPLYLELVKVAQTWGTPEQLGLFVGMVPDMLAKIRQAAPEQFILLEGDVAEENDLMDVDDLTPILAAGLSLNGDRLLLPIPPKLLEKETIGTGIKQLREQINIERQQVIRGNPTCDLWLPDVCFLRHQPHRDLILQLYDIGCIIFGDHVQSSGETFPYYIDLRRIISTPQIFHQIVGAYGDILETLSFDRIAGIPYGSLPTATGLSLRLQRPMIFPRKEVKAYGAGRLIEGHFQPGETIVVVDDILITGNSVIQGAEKLKSAGLNVHDIVVLIDHERGVKERLKDNNYQAHAVLTLSEIAETLYEANRITEEQFNFF
ncbi:Bifunctional enzyme PyrF/PyrE (Includes: Orotidine 5'-phosphate decarboxylase; Orotate phosphoribosyltransferase) [Planktothrix sp. PCC 11201]|uniref:bifunctional orotidine-5'-phosphate decarboxylase/orotate phosphoribosyltransferase n=1 Tax=Planktothrix sp. PCC 11201 TaxID=1729650 RepID=UPI00092122ED|nr:bifunctional orotidine-5'-phosphate decarboxylase/orotate phosphoribosyltransferase [Planktothrix sp. PCC 11201]SKB14326.1 Bifunctional enzyme PyrF/PyrE (Includes: Orotidine 5'-phosphate decarboxylase; Orotate phosphoribosyltransferase) [Planktothrix sp. PCC 11201]